MVVTLVGGIVTKREERTVKFQEAWYGAALPENRRMCDPGRNKCSHVVLDTKTRGRMDILCPDCVPPILGKRQMNTPGTSTTGALRKSYPLIVMPPGSMTSIDIIDGGTEDGTVYQAPEVDE